MRHVAAHRLADASAGRLSERETERIAQHLRSCASCTRARDRVVEARRAMDDIGASASPDLSWDQIGVRLYWETSSARHRALRRQPRSVWRRPAILAVGGVALAAGALVLFTMWRAGGEDRPAFTADRAAPAAPIAPAAALTGVVTYSSGAVTVGGAAVDADALFARPIAAGDRIATGDGRLVVQFGPASGFALAPGSTLEVRRFDERAVELDVVGAVEVDVSRRAPGQTFSIRAGRHRVTVHGTAFRVDHRAGDLAVDCAHGEVVVSDGAADVAVAAGEHIEVPRSAQLAAARREPIDAARLAELEDSLAHPLLPAWTAARALFDTSSIIEVEAELGLAVRVDGVEVGKGSFAMRVMSGRHQVQVGDESGRQGAGTWVDVEPGARQSAAVTAGGALKVGPTASSAPVSDARAARRVRRGQLEAALSDTRRARQCLVPLEKQDLVEGSLVVFDIGVNADGTLGHLNVAHSNVPPEVERCLRRVVDALELPPGPAATVRYKMAF